MVTYVVRFMYIAATALAIIFNQRRFIFSKAAWRVTYGMLL